MRKASNIIFLVSAIVSIVAVISLLITSFVFLAFTTPEAKEEIIKALQDGRMTTSVPGTINEQADAIQAIFKTFGIVFLFASAFGVANTVICFVARKKHTTAILVLSIVFGVLSFVEINIVASIFGFIANARQEE